MKLTSSGLENMTMLIFFFSHYYIFYNNYARICCLDMKYESSDISFSQPLDTRGIWGFHKGPPQTPFIFFFFLAQVRPISHHPISVVLCVSFDLPLLMFSKAHIIY